MLTLNSFNVGTYSFTYICEWLISYVILAINMKTRHFFGFLRILSILVFALPFAGACDEYPSFAIIGDLRLGFNESIYTKFLSQIDSEGINLFIIVGDVINEPGNEDEWKRFFDLTGNQKKVHIAPGNHDVNNYKSLKIYKKYIENPPYHSFSSGDTQFVVLSSEMPDSEAKIIGKQLSWLKGELEKPFLFRIVFIHRPLFSTVFGKNYSLDRFIKERDMLHELFVKYGVSAVFSGHEHLYGRIEKDGITYIITGGGGAPLHRFNEESGGFFHYIVAKRNENGYVFSVFDIYGNKRDTFSIKK